MEINASATLGLTQHFEQPFSLMKVTSGCSHHREIGIAEQVAIILQKKKTNTFLKFLFLCNMLLVKKESRIFIHAESYDDVLQQQDCVVGSLGLVLCTNVKKTTNASAFLAISTGNIGKLFSSYRVSRTCTM